MRETQLPSDHEDIDVNLEEAAEEETEAGEPRPLTRLQQNMLDDITKHKVDRLIH